MSEQDPSGQAQPKPVGRSDAMPETMLAPETTIDPSSGSHSQGVVPEVGSSLGKYQVTGLLGQGGMGVVLKARDPSIDRVVAVKVLARHLTADTVALARFVAEAKSVGKVSHPNVSTIYEIAEADGQHFLAMEYLPGGSLADMLLSSGPLAPLDAVRATMDTCRGLAAAHAAGLIHRDIKPANLLRSAEGSTKMHAQQQERIMINALGIGSDANGKDTPAERPAAGATA